MIKPEMVQLGEISEINPQRNFELEASDECSFIPMDAVDETTASVMRLQTRPFEELRKGYTPFIENDVIIAKITPCMENGKCAIAKRLKNAVGFGSTEFHVLRAGKTVIPEWLFYYWRLPDTRRFAELNMTGSAGQKRVPEGFLQKLRIPLPALADQQKMVSRLKKADRLRQAYSYSYELIDRYLPAMFLEMFGDPLENPKGFQEIPAGQLYEIQLGKMLDAKRFTGKHLKPYLGNVNVQWGRFDLTNLKFMDFPNDFEEFRLIPGDLL